MALFSFGGLSNQEIVELASLSNASYAGASPPSGWTTLSGATLGFVEGSGTGSYSGTTYQGSNIWLGAPAARVYQKGSELTISFRGTDSGVDYVTYLDIVGNNNYINAFSSFLDAIAGYISNPINAISSVNVVGHSLGAAAANILRNVSSTQNDGVFDSATYFTVATPKVSSNPDILNIGFENDWVYKTISRTTPFTASDFFSTTDNIVLYDDAYSGEDWPGFVFGPSDTSAHSSTGYIEAVERIIGSSFYDEMNRDSVVIVVSTDAQVSDKSVSTSDHFGSDAFFVGRDQADDILGGVGVDRVDALDGDDTIEGGGGNDIIEGGDGKDVAVFSGDCLEYNLSKADDGTVTITHARGAQADGTDTLTNVEVARFADGKEIDLTVAELYGCTILRPAGDFFDGTTSGGLIFLDWTREGDLSYPIPILNDGTVISPDAAFLDGTLTAPVNQSSFQLGGVALNSLTGFPDDVIVDVVYSVDPPDGPLADFVTFEFDTVRYLFVGDGVDTRGGTAFGDPHLLTFDNVAFDFQAAGEFVLARATSGTEYEVQARFVALSSAVSVTQAAATSVDGITVALQANSGAGLLEIDGVLTMLTDGGSVSVGSGSVSRNGRTIEIDHGNGDITSVDVFGSFLNVSPQPSLARADGSMEGLLGNANGTPVDDFKLADGTVLTTPIPVETLYGEFAASWTVEAEDSLLPGVREEYDAPDRIVTIESLPTALRAAAESAVDAEGITNPILREAAILDFALTGNNEFIEAAALTEDTFDPLVETVPVDLVSNPVVILTSDTNVLNEEDAATRTATFTVSRGDTDGDLTVNYQISGVGTAPANSADFLGGIVSGSAIIADGEEITTFDVEVVDDDVDEGPETLDVSIFLQPDDADDFELLVSSVRLTVEDDDEPPALNEVSGTTDRDYLIGTAADDVFLFKGGYGDAGRGNGGNDQFDLSENAANGIDDNTRILDWSDGDMIVGIDLDDVNLETVRSSSTAIRFGYGEDNDVLTITGIVPSSVESLFGLDQIA